MGGATVKKGGTSITKFGVYIYIYIYTSQDPSISIDGARKRVRRKRHMIGRRINKFEQEI